MTEKSSRDDRNCWSGWQRKVVGMTEIAGRDGRENGRDDSRLPLKI
ncbi:MAG: hypothetical protein M0P11_09625 [Anaerolineaceae bacterium]|nr:hypothetical protein [Anaerolineaceae bacterium]